MSPEEIGKHRDRGQQIADDDSPPGQLRHYVRAQEQHHRDEEDLERDEKDHQREQQRRLSLASLEQQSSGDAECDERAKVDQRVLERQQHQPVMYFMTVASVQNRRRQQRRRLEGVAANYVEDEEPDSDHDRADEPRDRSIDDDPRPRVFHLSTSNAQGSHPASVTNARVLRVVPAAPKRVSPEYRGLRAATICRR